ncbi:MAG: DUF2268 domain-containing putative Zn-dependent protease [Minisyncoccia bacterium]
MNITPHLLDASGRLDVYEASIRSAFEEGLRKVEAVLALPAVDVVVADNPDAAIPETGVGGFSPSAHLVYISIDPLHPALEKNLEREIQSTLAHELHHCARWQAVGYGKTLLEALVSEGLADHFDLEVNGGEPKPWSVAIGGDALEAMQEKAKADFFNEHYNHAAWFFGSQQDGIPRWAGYSLGFHLAAEYMKKMQKSAADLVAEDAKLFIE